ncbi:MAG: NAD-dependent epimerase/dehydratase family protein [Deltaproteobacteria bacterium]
MRAFVTGGTGFIGGRLIDRLLRDGDSVKALARDERKAAELNRRGVETIVGDILDIESLRGALVGADVLFHLGNVCKWWIPDKSLYQRVNVEGTRKLMELALEEGVGRAVFTSSLAAIRQPGGAMTTEDMAHPGDFESAYGRSKFLAERELLKLHSERGLPVVILNPGVVIGPGDVKTFAKTLIKLLNGELKAAAFEDSLAPIVYIDDVVDAHIRAARWGRTGHRYIIVGENIRVRDLYKLVAEMTGAPLPQMSVPPFVMKLIAAASEIKAFFTGAPPEFSLDAVRAMQYGGAGLNRKACQELGVKFHTPREAIASIIDWCAGEGLIKSPARMP